MYYALVKNKHISIYTRKIDAIYAHINYSYKDRVRFRIIRNKLGDKMIANGEASLVK